MQQVFPPSHDPFTHPDWLPKLKNYPHFDAPIPLRKIPSIVKNTAIVASNQFFPFLFYYEEPPKFGRTKAKPRKIRFAARKDSYILSYYRYLLSQKYEEKLKLENLHSSVIAYRKVPCENGKGNKCNIHFARDAFAEIINRQNCYAVALDISSYFENIDHQHLYKLWCDLISFQDLPPDHMNVYKNITRYAEVDFEKVCNILGYKDSVVIDGVKKYGFKDISREDFYNDKEYRQLCSPKIFREKIVGAKIIHNNTNNFGIPQGSPISDLLANLNLLNFDREIASHANTHSIYYRRYSDDILLILPKNENLLKETLSLVSKTLKSSGEQLKIKETKTVAKDFHLKDGALKCKSVAFINDDKSDKFEYLGFSFNGKVVRIKDSTMHRFYRKATFSLRSKMRIHVRRYADKSLDQLRGMINFSTLYQKYGNIKDFELIDFSTPQGKKKLTFISYAKKSLNIMKGIPSEIDEQVKHHKSFIKKTLEEELLNARAQHKRKLKKKEQK